MADLIDWIDALTVELDAKVRSQLLKGNAPPDAAAQLHAGVLAALYTDRERALRLHAILTELRELKRDRNTEAWAARTDGHVFHVSGDYEKATVSYEQAAALFEAEGFDLEVGRTLSSGLQALIYRGKYDIAMEWAGRAEAIFHAAGDLLRLARLDSNVGNILFRQDRPKEAVARYKKALEGFELSGEPRDTAAVLSNLAVASINLGQFADALSYYQKAREHCEEHGLASLSARADYNIAYLYYLRGDYTEARKLYQVSREQCLVSGDTYHSVLCDLDEAEMYLELNLVHEGELAARRAVEGFAALNMPYEQAKALVNLAVAGSQRRDVRFADKTLRQARRLFVQEKNPVWPALVDQLRAVIAFHELRFDQAQRLSSSAWRVLTRTMVPGRAAHCQILLARLWLRAGYADRARAICREALEHAGTDLSPSLRFHAGLVQGEIHEMQGRWDEALEAYESARSQVEDLRARVDTEDLRISILKDKLAVYEGLVALCLDSPAAATSGGAARAFMLVQQAKSRSLADRLSAPTRSAGSLDEEGDDLRTLRQDLNWVYRQIELAAVLDRVARVNRADALRDRARDLEAQLLNAKQQAAEDGSAVAASAASRSTDDLSAIQRSLRDGELLVEYYEARGVLYAFLLSGTGLEAVRLGSSVPVKQTLKLLQFQLGKYRWGRDLGSGQKPSLDAASFHFRELYRYLIAPIADQFTPYRHLIIAPHRSLHGLPFAALNDGSKALTDRFTLSVAPSGNVFAGCRSRRRRRSDGAVVMAVPDPQAPRIEDEARMVAATLSNAKLLVGKEASYEAFRKFAPSARILHLAAHGIFRHDNPMFSALQLADSRLSLLDLNDIGLNVELLTLSACNTGSAVAVGGDELLGLMRGFLLAGARSLLVALWEIDDASTKEFMRSFYREVKVGATLATAVQTAMGELRERYPHPYYWAPFLLVGDPDAITGL